VQMQSCRMNSSSGLICNMIGNEVCTSVDIANLLASCWWDNIMDCGDSESNSSVLSDIKPLKHQSD
jgi:hypothetical protein